VQNIAYLVEQLRNTSPAKTDLSAKPFDNAAAPVRIVNGRYKM
jgi:hypothetical protein